MSEVVMYIVVNKEAKMSGGKLAAQVAHSACKVVYSILEHGCDEERREDFDKWWNGSYTKVILKASEYELRQLKEKYHRMASFTIDEGRTEIPKGTLTTVAFVPVEKDKAPDEIKSLKLL
jgi:peptidyl-tRNA hydrolase